MQVKYLQDFAERFRLNIQYNTEVVSVARQKSHKSKRFVLKDQQNMVYKCDALIVRYASLLLYAMHARMVKMLQYLTKDNAVLQKFQ